MIDTHSHLYLPEFNEDWDEVMARLMLANVEKVLLPNVDVESIEWMKTTVSKAPNVFKPMMGLHPCSVKKETFTKDLEAIKNELFSGNYIAVGEIGMDLYWDKTTKDIQEEALKMQCFWANELRIPVALHTRNATKEVVEIVKQLNLEDLTGVFHCFGDGVEEAHQIIDLGFKLGIGGVLTFKNSGLDKVLEKIDLEHLVLETDSPYLAPAPHRGKRNESSYTFLVAQRLADVKQVNLNEVAEITTKNAQELFKI
ncbi:MAG: TatD family hydrolase [Flavobacteriales bacterium]|nr:TatD family hydrolase [Flavobacteriales bacterium]